MRTLLGVLAVMAAFPVAASAASIHDDLEAAHRYWRSDVCRGQWQVVPDTTLPERGAMGEATGLAFTHNPHAGVYESNGTRWDWHVDRCVFSMDPSVRGRTRRCVVAHEVGHFVHGPAHVGPMAADVWGGCQAVADALDRQDAERARKHRHKTRRAGT